MLTREALARKQALTQAKLRHGLLRRYKTEFDDERSGRQSVDEGGKYVLNSPCEAFLLLQMTSASTGGKGTE